MSESMSHKDGYVEINLLDLTLSLARVKWVALVAAVVGVLVGHYAAVVKGPVFTADAVISSKETSAPKASASGLGLLGNMMMSQLNIGGSASLAEVEQLLGSRSFHLSAVTAMGIQPDYMRVFDEKSFRKNWDESTASWRKEAVLPKDITLALQMSRLVKFELEQGSPLMKISIESPDSLFSYKVLNGYLEYLDRHVRDGVRSDAASNRTYLEAEMQGVADPLLRAKLQELISAEVEREMLVNRMAFKVVDSVYVAKSTKAFKVYPIAAAALFFLIPFCIAAFAFFVRRVSFRQDDENLAKQVGGELLRLPFMRRN